MTWKNNKGSEREKKERTVDHATYPMTQKKERKRTQTIRNMLSKTRNIYTNRQVGVFRIRMAATRRVSTHEEEWRKETAESRSLADDAFSTNRRWSSCARACIALRGAWGIASPFWCGMKSGHTESKSEETEK